MADDFPPPIPYQRGRSVRLSLPRRFVGDILHFAKKVPTIPMQRRMALAEVISARAAAPQRISWCAIFLKAYGIVAAQRPELRRAYLPFPWPRLYEHPVNVASFSLERVYQDEDAVFFARLLSPEQLPLAEIDAFVRHHKTAPIESIPSFRQALWISRLPRPLRRFLWWLGLETEGAQRARFFGTFGLSVVASLGAAGLHLLSPLATALNYGTFDDDGNLDVRITYDHRVLDGAPVARALAHLEEVLRGEIVEELLEHARVTNGAAVAQ
jgi:hypothetical protein